MSLVFRYIGIRYKGIKEEQFKPYTLYPIPYTFIPIYILLFLLFTSCASPQKKQLLTGADILIRNHLNLLNGKQIGIVTNHTALLKNRTHLVDTLNTFKEFSIKALFSPEHGIRGKEPAGEKIKDGFDHVTQLPVFSLYGAHNKPTREMLKDIDLLIYDIQDVGARFYTYITTLFYVLEASAENNIPLLILDRPNPIDGITIEGPILKDELKSFVGITPVPIRYGMTPGELAQFFVGEDLIGNNLKPDFKVIKMEGWERDSYFNDYDIEWINPSPNITSFETALVYPGTCLLEGTNVSEGRGTLNPFLTIGAPFINSDNLVNELNKFNIEGINISAASFTPVVIPRMAGNPKFRDKTCYGISVEVKDKRKFRSVNFGIYLLYTLVKLYPDDFKFNSYFNKLAGDKSVREMLSKGIHPEEIIRSWDNELAEFKAAREKYILY